MARTIQRIAIGKNIKLEQTPTKEIISAVALRRQTAFANASPRLKERARAEVPVYMGPDPRALPGALMATIETGITKTGNLYLAAGGAGARHAHLVEFGTVKMAPDSFMRRSIAKERTQILKELKVELGKTPLTVE